MLQEWEGVTLALEPGDTVKAYEPLLRCAHNLKGSAALTGLAAFRASIHRVEDHLVKIRDLGLAPSPQLIAALLLTEKVFRDWTNKLAADPSFVRPTLEAEDALAALTAPESTVAAPRASGSPGDAESGDKRMAASATESLRVAVGKLDRLIQLVGEISLQQSIIDRAAQDGTLNSGAVRAAIELKSKITQDLRDAALALRMVPLHGLFQKVERVVTETAHQLGKQLHVARHGDDVSLDKLVIERMLDPLIHIARNAVDHGIESVMERVQAGKNPHGKITISAENNAAGVTIHFEDDGKGIDPERVYQKALAQGRISPNDTLNESAKLNLIFLSGLSTADSVNEFSGRGVGMDVVADTVKRMGGRLEIKSTPGKGTQITISLPTNLSILDALIVKVNGSQYAIPTQDLTEVIDLREFQPRPVNGGDNEVIDFRGKQVPVESLSLFLAGGVETRDSFSPTRARAGLIVIHRDEPLALEVDAVTGQQQIYVRPINELLAPTGFYGGSTILSDGEPAIILDLPQVARQFFTSH